MRIWPVLVVTAIFTVVACGGSEAAIVNATPTPIWTALDAKVLLRDYLISTHRIAGGRLTGVPNVAVLRLLATFDEWESVYEGEGWWRVSGSLLGWGLDTSGKAEDEDRDFRSRAWLVSERTSFVAPDTHSAAHYFACLNAPFGCGSTFDVFGHTSTSTKAGD